MIIISQDKEKMVNFDNVVALWVETDCESDTIKYLVNAETDSMCVELGCYSSLKKAKRVLDGIMEFYVGHLDCYAMPDDFDEE